jgi:hypothetical protein
VSDEPRPDVDYAGRHLRFGWWSLLVYATCGLGLEALHGFKVAAYLDVSNETRRLMWTLAHAHGTLLSAVHILFGLHLKSVPDLGARHRRVISACLVGASIVLPGGFFLGGIRFYAGDPGLGVVLVPIGATLLVIAIFYIAADITADRGPAGQAPARAGRRPPK